MPFSQYVADAILNWTKNAVAFPAEPTAVYVALFNGNPTSGGTEITNTIKGTANRDAVTLGAIATSGTNREVSNSELTITASAAAGATADYVAIYDAQTAGNLLYYEALTASKTITTGDEVKFDSTNLKIQVKIA